MDSRQLQHFALFAALYLIASAGASLQNAEALSAKSLRRANSSSSAGSALAISSNSVLVALLDSQYAELAELVEKALLLQALEEVVGGSNITILAPQSAFLEKNLDPVFKKFMHEPGNLESLQKLLRFHVIPRRITAEEWSNATHESLSKDVLQFSVSGHKKGVGLSVLTHPNAVVRPDGVIHGIDKMLIPRSVQGDFNAWRSGLVLAVKPEGAPAGADHRKSRKPKSTVDSNRRPNSPLASIQDPLAPGSLPAPAPAPGSSSGPHWLNGESQVKDFIHALVHYGGYNEMADILVNLTSLASELAKLVSEGYKITVLAPNDEAMGRLTAGELSEPRAPEQIVYYHIIPEYQTEDSLYNAVRRFGKVKYDTLRIPHKVSAREADGIVLFGDGNETAHLYDHDIYIDGRISVQGIDRVLSPREDIKGRKLEEGGGEYPPETDRRTPTPIPSRGRMIAAVCYMLDKFGHGSVLPNCQHH